MPSVALTLKYTAELAHRRAALEAEHACVRGGGGGVHWRP